jgi:transcriptional regulator with XRE-family HTH domain
VNDDGPPVDDVLGAVGPRLRALRQQRGATLTQLSRSTGISVSTLSRLESGQRRPTLELLLLLARAHQVPLDRLVDSPETGDPRIRSRPIKRHGVTFIPLTRRPGRAPGLQADLLPQFIARRAKTAGPRGL